MELPILTYGLPYQSWNLWLLIIALLNLISSSVSINCYTCSSKNGSEPWCEDPIDTTQAVLTEGCRVPKENHKGMFSANFCLKIVGKGGATGEKLVIRACSQDSMDNQCGEFKYENVQMSGCVLTCNYNGCNSAHSLTPTTQLPAALVLTSLYCLPHLVKF